VYSCLFVCLFAFYICAVFPATATGGNPTAVNTKSCLIIYQCCFHVLVLVRSLPGLSLTSRRNLENALANSSRTLSPLSNMAAKLPLTIFGDIGELASRRLDPKLEFRSRVSV
jgi:hypothetical protein